MDEASVKSLDNLSALQSKFQALASQALTNGANGTGLSATKRETTACIEELSQQLLFLGTHTLDILSKQNSEVDVLDVKLASMHTVRPFVIPPLTIFLAHESCAGGSKPYCFGEGHSERSQSFHRLTR